MKDKLTIEQSYELVRLGVPSEKASEVYVIEGFFGISYRPCFTLADTLELLPATASDGISAWPLLIKRHGKQWSAGYGQIILFIEDELIDAAYGLNKWMLTEYNKPKVKSTAQ